MPRRTNLEIRTSDLENGQIILRNSVVEQLKMLKIENQHLKQEMAELKQGLFKRIDIIERKHKKKLSLTVRCVPKSLTEKMAYNNIRCLNIIKHKTFEKNLGSN